jgi:hypothetical protein
MIHVVPASEPVSFQTNVREPGLRAIAEMVGKPPPYPRTSGRPHTRRYFPQPKKSTTPPVPITNEADLPAEEFPAYWTNALDDLKTEYRYVCAYSCFRIHEVTGAASVDHMVAKSKAWNCVYEWDNYRLACSRLNARKSDFPDVLDPFEVEDGWFELELVGFQVLPGKDLTDTSIRDQVQATIDRLCLNDFRKDRETDANAYWDGHISLVWLTRESPFVARELRRQGRLRDGDT